MPTGASNEVESDAGTGPGSAVDTDASAHQRAGALEERVAWLDRLLTRTLTSIEYIDHQEYMARVRSLQSRGVVFASDEQETFPFLIKAAQATYLQVDEKGAIKLTPGKGEASTFTAWFCGDDHQVDLTKRGFYLKEMGSQRCLVAPAEYYGASVYFSGEQVDDTALCYLTPVGGSSFQIMVGILALSLESAQLVDQENTSATALFFEDMTLSSRYGAPVEPRGLQQLGSPQLSVLSDLSAENTRFDALLSQFVMSRASDFLALNDRQLSFVIGAMGGGKSSLINLLLNRLQVQQVDGSLAVVDTFKPHASTSSQVGRGWTLFTEMYHVEGTKLALGDTPGFHDRDSDNQLIHAITMRLSLALAKEIGPIIIVFSSSELVSCRGRVFLDTVELLSTIVPSESWDVVKNNLYFVVNTQSDNSEMNREAVLRTLNELMDSFRHTALVGAPESHRDAIRVLQFMHDTPNLFVWRKDNQAAFRGALLQKLQTAPKIEGRLISFSYHDVSAEALTEFLMGFVSKHSSMIKAMLDGGQSEAVLQQKKPFILGVVVPIVSLLHKVFSGEFQQAGRGADSEVFSDFFEACKVSYGVNKDESLGALGTEMLFKHRQSLFLNWPGWQAKLNSHFSGVKGFCYAVAGQIICDDKLKLYFYPFIADACFANSSSDIATALLALLDDEAVVDDAFYHDFVRRFKGLRVVLANHERVPTGYLTADAPARATIRLVVIKRQFYTVYAHPKGGYGACLQDGYPESNPVLSEYHNRLLHRWLPGAKCRIKNHSGGLLMIDQAKLPEGLSDYAIEDYHVDWGRFARRTAAYLNEEYRDDLKCSTDGGEQSVALRVKATPELSSAIYARLWGRHQRIESTPIEQPVEEGEQAVEYRQFECKIM